MSTDAVRAALEKLVECMNSNVISTSRWHDAWDAARAALAQEAQPVPEPLSDVDREDCIDRANRAFNAYRSTPGAKGQQATWRDDWKHWLAIEVERIVIERMRGQT